jgi:hypothetical protein
MVSLLSILFEYQHLRGCKALHVPLDSSEQSRLVGLSRLLRGDRPDLHGRREMPRLPCPLAVQFTTARGFGHGRIRDLSGGGMAIRALRPLEVGTRLLVHVRDPVAGTEYVFPARVVWSGEQTMGVAFDGVPSRSERQANEPRPRRLTPLVA